MRTDYRLIEHLRRMKEQHMAATEMLASLLDKIQQLGLNGPNLNFMCLIAFREAFDLGLRQAMPIAGWCGFEPSPECEPTVSNENLNLFLDAELYGEAPK